MHRIFYKLALTVVVLLATSTQVKAAAFQLAAYQQQSRYKGEHEAITKVIWSSDQEIIPEGGQSSSIIKFSQVGDAIYPSWIAQNWKTIRNKVVEFKDNYLKWEVETKTVDGKKYVFVRSVLQVTFPNEGLPFVKGFHKLYHDGNIKCSYITKSYLYPKK